jgi:tetratricopeptide (TPR) repeat protein
LGQVLGSVEVRELPDAEPGQFRDGWLVLQPRGPRKFLCCPPGSALNQLRRALDGGFDEPGVHVLHAQIWERAGQPALAWSLLQSRAAVLLEDGDPATLDVFAQIALRAGALPEFLHYSRRRAVACPERSREILCASCLAVADHYGQRGDAELYREFCYRALHLRPDDADLCLRVADAEWSAGRTAQALPLYRRTLELAPPHARRAEILARLASEPAAPAAQSAPAQ